MRGWGWKEYFLAIVGLAMEWLCLDASSNHALEQERRNATWLPMQALVKSAKMGIRVFHGRRGSTYEYYHPKIDYVYTVAGVEYEGDQTSTMDEDHGEDWTNEMIDLHPPGRVCEGFYNPDDPRRSFLVRDLDFSPYWGVLFFAFPLWICGVCTLRRKADRFAPDDDAPNSEGVANVAGETSLGYLWERLVGWTLLAGMFGFSGWAFLHWAHTSPFLWCAGSVSYLLVVTALLVGALWIVSRRA